MHWLDNRSRMSGDVHVRFCESPRGEGPSGYSTVYGNSFNLHLSISPQSLPKWLQGIASFAVTNKYHRSAQNVEYNRKIAFLANIDFINCYPLQFFGVILHN